MAGTDIEGTADHLREVQETESNTVKCVPNYRNRLKHVIQFWKDHYPEYYNEVVFDLTQAQKCDTRRYHTATQDLQFELLNLLMIKLFLSGHAKTQWKEASTIRLCMHASTMTQSCTAPNWLGRI